MINACRRAPLSLLPARFIAGCPRDSKARVSTTARRLSSAQLCREEEVVVVGGGNSAGQAAVFLAQTSKCVHMLVRSDGLAASMSRYLIRRIEENPAMNLRTCTEIVALEGNKHLERVQWRDKRAEKTETREVRHIFVMTGAVPNTAWLGGCLSLDAKGFVKTGMDLSHDDLMTAHWPLTRPPFLLEASLPGVFAVGDVRSGNVKRVASANCRFYCDHPYFSPISL
jgi:thioredoxin reductase (NADPH)